MNEIFSVKDQVVVITGGTGVLGRCIGEYLATQGAKVVLMGRRKEEGDDIVNEIKAKGGEAMFLVTDVMDAKVVQANSTAAGGSAVASQELSAQANTLNGLIRQFRIQ